MYIRKILVGILIIGVIVGCFLMYSISQTIFKPITAFNNDEAYLYIPSNSDFEFVKKEIAPLLNDMQAFETLAKKLGYTKRVKGGKYIIRKGMNSNDIVKTLLDKSVLVEVVVPDVRTFKELAQEISNQIEATEEEMMVILKDAAFLKGLIKTKKLKDPLIYVPGTYKMPWNTSAAAFRSFMANGQQQNQQ